MILIHERYALPDLNPGRSVLVALTRWAGVFSALCGLGLVRVDVGAG